MPSRKRKPAAHAGQAAEPQALSLDEVRALRLQAQGLAPRRPRRELVKVVQTLGGINAQLVSAMELSLRARVAGLTEEDVEAARVKKRALVRTWCMRGTLHLLAAEEVDWLLASLRPKVVEGGWRWLKRRAGLSRARAEKVLDEAHKILKRAGPLTRADLMAAVAEKLGDAVKPAAAGVVWLGGMLGRMAFGPDQGAKQTYVALEAWLGRQVKLAGKADIVEVARRYLQGYGPATPKDFAAWWGLPLTEARSAFAALEDELAEVRVDGQAAWRLASAPTQADLTERTVRLLPAFDQYLLGYDRRDFAVQPKHKKVVFHGGQMAPVVLVDGLVQGTWRYERRGQQMRIAAEPFSTFTREVRDLIAEEADDIARFYGLTAALSFKRGS